MAGLYLNTLLELETCPRCGIDRPSLVRQWSKRLAAYDGSNTNNWAVYACERCAGAVLASAAAEGHLVHEVLPRPAGETDPAIPEKAREFLRQAHRSLQAPAGCVMLAASAVDAMLKAIGYKEGSLFNRIDQAATDHKITDGMANWAHQVRLDANDQRHADENANLPTPDDATRLLDFAAALAQFLFVLPARVTRGVESSTPKQ